jgi:glycosyltransferase involved in cell wall biosynthesis
LCPESNLDTLVKAAALVLSDLPGFRLWIAGDGPSWPELLRLIGQLGLSEQVRLLGPVSDMSALLQQARTFVAPSSDQDAPSAVLAAMAIGLPVVATNAGSVPEIVVDGVSGLLAQPRDPAGLASALVRLQKSDMEAGRMGAHGRCRVEEHFDVRSMVAAYEDLYTFNEVSLGSSPVQAARGRHVSDKILSRTAIATE